MKRRLFRSDSGATLLLVLLVITTVSLVMGAILTQADTSVRATVALRDQASSNYGSDAAAQAIIKQLQDGTMSCDAPAGTTKTLGSGTGSPFYPANGSANSALNAVANCQPDTVNGTTVTPTNGIGTSNVPGSTLVTVGTNPGSEAGITGGGGGPLCITGGGLLSFSTITGKISAGLTITGDLTICPNLFNLAVSIQAYGGGKVSPLIQGCLATFTVTPCTQPPTGTPPPAAPPVTVPAPNYPITVAGSPNNNDDPDPVCLIASSGKIYAAFLPGRYRKAQTANGSLSKPCKNSSGTYVAPDYEWFTPGVYYFDYGGTTWTLPKAGLIGGTPTTALGAKIPGLDPTSQATLTASASNLSSLSQVGATCMSPQTQTNNGGVEFVFGGASTMTTSGTTTGFGLVPLPASMNICAQYSPTTIPVAIYGVSGQPLVEGAATIPVESGCVTALLNNGGCSLIRAGAPLGTEDFHVDGYVYAPAAAIQLNFNVYVGFGMFRWGALLRTFQVNIAVPPLVSLVSTPVPVATTTTTTSYSIRYLSVWTCPAAATPCAQTGTPNVGVKLQTMVDGTWKVLSWSHAG